MALLTKELLKHQENDLVQKLGIEYYIEDLEALPEGESLLVSFKEILYDLSIEEALILNKKGYIQLTEEEKSFDNLYDEVGGEKLLHYHQIHLITLTQDNIQFIHDEEARFEAEQKEMKRQEELCSLYKAKIENIKFENEDLQYVYEHRNDKGIYADYIQQLLRRNGYVTEDYIIFDETGLYPEKNPKVIKKGFEVHHIKENYVSDLSKKDRWYAFPEYQAADTLVYADKIEHSIAHYLIAKEDIFHSLGQGGLFNHHMLKGLQANKIISDNDYYNFCYLIGAICPRIAVKVEQVLNNTFTPVEEEDRMLRFERTKSALMHNHPYGISTMTIDEYEKILDKKCKKLRDYGVTEIIVLRTKGNHFMLMAQNKKKTGYYLLNGAAVSSVMHDPEWYYHKIDDYQLLCSTEGASYLSKIELIIQFIQSKGGSGRVHGSIIDIDYFHHLKIDFVNQVFVPYEALDTSSRTIFPSLITMLDSIKCDNQLESTAIVPAGTQSLQIYEDGSGFRGLVTPIVENNTYHYEKGFYSHHYNISRVIEMGATDIITKWFEKFDTDAFWVKHYNRVALEDGKTIYID